MIVFKKSTIPIDYQESTEWMDSYVKSIQNQTEPSLIWLLEHPPLYSMGTSAQINDILNKNLFPIYDSNRGGQITYHGPGQRIIYCMIDLNKGTKDIRHYVSTLEQWMINVLDHIGIIAERRKGRVGLWVQTDNTEKKIAAIGVRVQKWVTSHGISLNINPNLKHFQGIVPCGISDFGITSIFDLGISITQEEIDTLIQNYCPFNEF
jgi:lipoyl(octanoyl) transferase